MSNTRGKLPTHAVAPALKRTFGITQTAPFRAPGMEEILSRASQLERDPSILAEDSVVYRDKQYVKAVSQLYWVIAKTTELPVLQFKKFRIGDMETAFAKLEKEHRDEYKELCKYWGIVPEQHSSKKATSGIKPHNHLKRLTRWGYFDLYFANMDDIVNMVANKTHTCSKMSKLDMAKYAMIFALFINGQCFMPYDADIFLKLGERFKSEGKSNTKPYDLKETVYAVMIPDEEKGCWNAGMLYYFYKKYMQELPNGSINLDAVMHFMDLIDYDHKLIIKEFMNMLSDDKNDGSSEKNEFRSKHLTPIMSNLGVRDLKEELFPFGPWESANTLFMMTVPIKEATAYRYAYNRFKKNGFKFGENVETVKTPYEAQHAHSSVKYLMPGYQYARSPMSIRVSDPNELWMMRLI